MVSVFICIAKKKHNSFLVYLSSSELVGSADYKRIQRLFNHHLLYNYTHLSYKPVIDYFRQEEASQEYKVLSKIAEIRNFERNCRNLSQAR
ncbi:MAG: hypothetical protein IPH52_27895 [Leptospiraceae bacterium]|nr:hypothetical protein [Leptospiraceae bacterium]